jgi:hypothetical protein
MTHPRYIVVFKTNYDNLTVEILWHFCYFSHNQDLARIFKEENKAADPLSLVLGGAVSSRVRGDTEAKARDEGEDPEAGALDGEEGAEQVTPLRHHCNTTVIPM